QLLEAEIMRQLEHALLPQGGERPLLHTAELLVELLLPLGHVLLTALLLEPDPYLLRRSGRLYEGQPIPARSVGTFGGQDLEDVAVLQLIVEGHHAAVRLGADATVPDLGVDPVGEVDRSRPAGQRQDVAAGGEDEDLVTEHVD